VADAVDHHVHVRAREASDGVSGGQRYEHPAESRGLGLRFGCVSKCLTTDRAVSHSRHWPVIWRKSVRWHNVEPAAGTRRTHKSPAQRGLSRGLTDADRPTGVLSPTLINSPVKRASEHEACR
jgi:hypothetical protein